jgi:hypothetical protein
VFESELQQAHAHSFRELQDLRVIRTLEICTRSPVRWNDDAPAVQRGIIRQFDPREHLRAVGQLRFVLPWRRTSSMAFRIACRSSDLIAYANYWLIRAD